MNKWQLPYALATNTAQKNEVFIRHFFSKCDQIRAKLRIWSHLIKKSLMENSISVQSKYNIVPQYKTRVNTRVVAKLRNELFCCKGWTNRLPTGLESPECTARK